MWRMEGQYSRYKKYSQPGSFPEENLKEMEQIGSNYRKHYGQGYRKGKNH
ncbi:MAG: hypothetical protein ACQEP5_07605 [Actinomycetota bacterium]